MTNRNWKPLSQVWPPHQKVRLTTSRFVIRSPEATDASADILPWFQDPAYRRSFPAQQAPTTVEGLKAFLTDQSKTNSRLLLVENQETPIGLIWVEFKTPRIAITHHYVGDRSWWGKGVIYEARAAVMNAVFRLGALKIIGNPNAEKRAVTQTYRDQGFTEEGRLRQERGNTDGTRSDILYFGLLAEEWGYERARQIPEKIRRRLARTGALPPDHDHIRDADPRFEFVEPERPTDHQRHRRKGEMLLVDGVQNVTMSNGLVRIQVLQTGADGKQKAVEEIAIPASQYGTVVQALQQAGQNLQQKVQEQQKQQSAQQQPAGQQQPAAASQQADDNFDFSNP